MASLKFRKLIAVILIITAQCVKIYGSPCSGMIENTNKGEELITRTSREEILDGENGKYQLIWEIDLKAKEITFQVNVRTLGFVGFGISPNGGMTGADIVMGGVFPNGTSYFGDYFSMGNEYPELDEKQDDWVLLEAKENDTHTMLKFKRLFDTCDEMDFKIGNDTSNLIWAFGEEDVIGYHMVNRGSYSVNLLDPPMPSLEDMDSTVSTWRITNDYEMPADDTTYWCTLHKSPPLESKHHVIGFEAYLPSKEAKAHTHHFIVHECRGPKTVGNGSSPFESLLSSDGDHCYKAGNAARLQPYCASFLLVWSTGGKRVVFPENVGYPISEANSNMDTYFMLQVHYNNPNKLKGVKFETGVNIFYTPKIREFDAATMTIGHFVTASQVIPPNTPSFTTVGHCSSECTAEAVPSSGVNFFNVLLHSHLAGRKMKLRQFRAGVEIPWISNDDNYNFNYQQNRPLREHIKLLPGDQLAMECIYDTTSRENVTIGGFGSTEEMCNAFVLYYPRTDLWFCGSSYSLNTSAEDFGIEKVQIVPGSTDTLVMAPERVAGKRYSRVLSEMDWTVEKIEGFQRKARFSPHDRTCRYVSGKKTNATSYVTYPDIKEEYAPLDICNQED